MNLCCKAQAPVGQDSETFWQFVLNRPFGSAHIGQTLRGFKHPSSSIKRLTLHGTRELELA
uniref:Uncharacterized protein n=1 Tax=Arundo donax TaxID=35708 RepID=A0A0A8Y839_ARUDO